MHLRNSSFEKAHTDFFEAFKNYDESGSLRRIVCLKYLVLANMLMKSNINPFDSQETKPFRNEPEVVAMTRLVNAYQNNDITEFESIISTNGDTIMSDPFIREHIEELLSNIRTEVNDFFCLFYNLNMLFLGAFTFDQTIHLHKVVLFGRRGKDFQTRSGPIARRNNSWQMPAVEDWPD